MGLFSRRKTELPAAKDAEPYGAKSLVLSDDALWTVQHYGWPFASAYGQIYRKQPAVRTVVDFLARNIGQLNLKTYVRLADSDRQELDGHPLAVLLRNPSPKVSRFRFMRDTVADIAVYDRAYWVKFLTQTPRAIVRMPPSQIVRETVDGNLVYRGPDGKIIPRDRLVIFPGYNPDGDWNFEDGVSPLETLRRVLAEEWAAQEHRENMWHNAARRDGVIERPADTEWSDEARARFRAGWQSTMAGGANAGRTAILEDGMHWNPDGFSPKDTEYIEGRKFTFEEVCREYGMSPQLFQGDSANANIESFHRHLYQDTFGPWLRNLQDEIELQLLPDLERIDLEARIVRGRVYTEFNIAEKLRGSFEEQGRTLTTAVGVPYMTVNEGRTRLNLSRIDDAAFDMPIQPLNVMYGGQPAVTVPTDVPQPGARATTARRKSAPQGALRRRQAAAEQHAELFRRYFRAQQQAVESKAAAFEMERWNGKLAGELYTARIPLARKTGKLAASQINGVYEEAQTLNFLLESASRQAESINAHTAEALKTAERPSDVFDIATSSRAIQLGLSTATAIIGFARTEAAKQSAVADGRQRTKTWVVTSQKSRHPEMDGETVGIDETFSNGCDWPGSGDADEAAGCQCLVDIS